MSDITCGEKGKEAEDADAEAWAKLVSGSTRRVVVSEEADGKVRKVGPEGIAKAAAGMRWRRR